MEPFETEKLLDREKDVVDGNNTDDEDDITSEENQTLLKSTIIDDFKVAFPDFKAALLIVALAIFLGYHLSVSPYKTHLIDQKDSVPQSMNDLKLIRPVLDLHEQKTIQAITLRAETQFTLPNQTISLRWHSSVNKYGNNRPPVLFYEGVMFGITSENSHNLIYTGDRSKSSMKDELKSDLMALEPTFLVDRYAFCNHTDWFESGYAAYFSFEDLKTSGRLSSDKLEPWKRITEDMLLVGRAFKQTYITLWYPKQFGANDAKDPHKFTNIVQQTIPTRTGLHDIKSTGVVWMTKVNNTEIVPKAKGYRQEWSEEEIRGFPSLFART